MGAEDSSSTSGGEEARQEEDNQRTRPTDVIEPEDSLTAHFGGYKFWTVASLPRLLGGGLMEIPGHAELWMLRITLKHQYRRVTEWHQREILAQHITPSLLLVRAAARMVAALVRPPQGLETGQRFCNLDAERMSTVEFWEWHLAAACKGWTNKKKFPQ